MRTNWFELIGLKQREAPHDRILAWLCDASAEHGFDDFASSLIDRLWGAVGIGSPSRVERPYCLSSDCRPDLAVFFPTHVLVIENKVNLASVREGQVQKQHDLATAELAKHGLGLLHVLLQPTRFPKDDSAPVESPRFRHATYADVAIVVREKVDTSTNAKLRFFLEDYADFIEREFGSRKVSRSLTFKSVSEIEARRRSDAEGAWTEQAFLEDVVKHGDEAFVEAHKVLLETLRATCGLTPVFVSRGKHHAMYRVSLDGVREDTLRVFANGGLQLHRIGLSDENWLQLTSAMRTVGLLADGHPDHSPNLVPAVGECDPLVVASLLQEAAQRHLKER